MKDIRWLLDNPDELVRQFDDLTDAEVLRLIEFRDKRRIAEALAVLAKRKYDDEEGNEND